MYLALAEIGKACLTSIVSFLRGDLPLISTLRNTLLEDFYANS